MPSKHKSLGEPPARRVSTRVASQADVAAAKEAKLAAEAEEAESAVRMSPITGSKEDGIWPLDEVDGQRGRKLGRLKALVEERFGDGSWARLVEEVGLLVGSAAYLEWYVRRGHFLKGSPTCRIFTLGIAAHDTQLEEEWAPFIANFLEEAARRGAELDEAEAVLREHRVKVDVQAELDKAVEEAGAMRDYPLQAAFKVGSVSYQWALWEWDLVSGGLCGGGIAEAAWRQGASQGHKRSWFYLSELLVVPFQCCLADYELFHRVEMRYAWCVHGNHALLHIALLHDLIDEKHLTFPKAQLLDNHADLVQRREAERHTFALQLNEWYDYRMADKVTFSQITAVNGCGKVVLHKVDMGDLNRAMLLSSVKRRDLVTDGGRRNFMDTEHPLALAFTALARSMGYSVEVEPWYDRWAGRLLRKATCQIHSDGYTRSLSANVALISGHAFKIEYWLEGEDRTRTGHLVHMPTTWAPLYGAPPGSN